MQNITLQYFSPRHLRHISFVHHVKPTFMWVMKLMYCVPPAFGFRKDFDLWPVVERRFYYPSNRLQIISGERLCSGENNLFLHKGDNDKMIFATRRKNDNKFEGLSR